MKQLKLPLDIMISHDWPQGIYNFGDVDLLVRKKPHFKEQTEPGCRMPLGSPANAEVLYHTRPSYWFSGMLRNIKFLVFPLKNWYLNATKAHMHVKWVALVDHDKLGERDEDDVDQEIG